MKLVNKLVILGVVMVVAAAGAIVLYDSTFWGTGDKYILKEGVRGCFVVVFHDSNAPALEREGGFNVLRFAEPGETIRTSSGGRPEFSRLVVVESVNGVEHPLKLDEDVVLGGSASWWSGRCRVSPICFRKPGEKPEYEWLQALQLRAQEHPELFSCSDK